jgi:hypothetical protein
MGDSYQELCARNARRFAAERAEREELQAQQQPPQQRSSEGLVYKTVYNSAPQQQQQEDPWADWNRWCESKIATALHDHIENYLSEFLVEIIALQREEMHELVEKKLGELRAEVEVQRGVVKSNNVELIKRGQNVA